MLCWYLFNRTDSFTLGCYLSLWTKKIKLAFELVNKATTLILEKYQTKLDVEFKGQYSEVTQIDKDCELLFREEIKKTFPNDGIIGEEFPDENEENGDYTWTLDPIDGTASLVRGVPFFGTMIGIFNSKTKEVQFGLVHYPALNETLYAVKGKGTFWKPSKSDEFIKCEVSKISSVEDATFCYSAIEYFRLHKKLNVHQKISEKVNMERSWGDCYGYSLVATGRAEIMMDPLFHIWDLVPLKIIIEEAGGKFTGRLGENDIYCNSGLATNGRFHGELVNLIKKVD